jgi:hypothetical protein
MRRRGDEIPKTLRRRLSHRNLVEPVAMDHRDLVCHDADQPSLVGAHPLPPLFGAFNGRRGELLIGDPG